MPTPKTIKTKMGSPIARPNARGRRDYTYGDVNFKGLGLLRCRVCDKPYTEHDYIGPCRELAMRSGDRLIADKRQRAAEVQEFWWCTRHNQLGVSETECPGNGTLRHGCVIVLRRSERRSARRKKNR